MVANFITNLAFYVPELIAIATMMGLLFLEATYKDNEKGKGYIYWTSILGLTMSFFSLVGAIGTNKAIFTNAVIIDDFSTILKGVMVLGTMGCIYLSSQSKDIYDQLKSEYVILAVGVLIGGMLLASANNMLTVYLGIETLSILSYVLATLKKNDDKSSEAGLKYVLYGGISAGIMLFGMSHIFGVLGTIQFSEVAAKLATLSSGELMILVPSFILFFAGIGYKISCVPFHMWTPDVYEGSPLPVTTFFAIVPKVAGIAVLYRVTQVFFSADGALQYTWIGFLQVLAALTMFVGNISAINQTSVKRMLAYSSIAHAGFMILGVVVINKVGSGAIAFYAVTYLFMTLTAFYITSFVQDKYGNDDFERFNGFIYRYPLMAIALGVAMFSLTGLPPFSGFVAKFHIIRALLTEQFYTLAVIAAVNSVISLYYYLKVVRYMVFNKVESEEEIQNLGMKNQLVIIGITLPVLLLGVFWEGLLNLARQATLFIAGS